MSDTEQDTSVLGKRARNGHDGLDGEMAGNVPPVNQEEDDDDEDVGPMPMPAAAANGAAKKKRKGVYTTSTCCKVGILMYSDSVAS
jgi:peptidylprolyl isomerase domain and WD repeat-containing protein 1